MKCEECLPRIEEYIDGELDGRTTERMTLHFSTCAGCAEELATLRREQEVYANYQRDIEVTPAQWNIVQARIEQEKDLLSIEPRASLRQRLGELFNSRKQFRPAFAAALVLLIIGITAGVIYLNSQRPQQENIASGPSKPNNPNLPVGAAGDLLSSTSNSSNKPIVEDKNRENDNSNQQAPAVASNRAPIAEQKRKAIARVNPPRSRNSLQTVSLQRGVVGNNKSGTDNNVEVSGSRDRAVNFTPLRAEPNFDSEIARHAEKAELLLRSFRNVRLPVNTRSLDVSYEKENARKLLYQNIALRREADVRGDNPATEVLNTLEPILLDIANLPNRAKTRDVRSIEQRMEKKEIVATLQVRTLVASN